MFAFCFTPAASTLIKQTQRPTTRRTRQVGIALAAFGLLVATAGVSHAGGFSGKSFKGLSGGGGGNSMRMNNNNGSNFAKALSMGSNKNFSMQNNQRFNINKNFGGLSKALKNQSPNSGLTLNKKLLDTFKPSIAKNNQFKNFDKVNLLNKSFKHFDKHHDHCHPKHNHCWNPCHRPWHCWDRYPTWCPLYRHGCGYYTSVPVVVVESLDLQLLAVRVVDAGIPDMNLGPRYRVWIRNNSRVAITRPFNAMAIAGLQMPPTQDLPQSGVEVPSIEAGQTIAVDIRLPIQANDPRLTNLYVLVDSHRDIDEQIETNNGTAVARNTIPPVDATPYTAAGMPTAMPN